MEEIHKLEQDIKNNQANLATKKSEVAEEIRRKYHILWGIQATPSDTRHVAHTVSNCVFTSKEIAQSHCSKPSYDSDDHVSWYYKPTPLDPADVSVDDLLHLDQNRSRNYPYCGW
jgi:hypothetical protein